MISYSEFQLKLKDLYVLILCGGLGTRLRAVVKDVPKPMAKINDKPFLDILLKYLSSYGIKNIVLSTCYLSKVIEDYYKSNWQKLNIKISKEPEPRGTAGGVKYSKKHIKSNNFLVINGDTFCNANLKQFYNFHLKKMGDVTILITKKSFSDSKDTGTIVLDKEYRIISFQEKQKNIKRYSNAGMYFLSKNIFNIIPDNKKCSLEYDIFPKLDKMYGYITTKRFIDIGTAERFYKAAKMFK